MAEVLCPTERRVLVESLVVLATPFAADGARTTHDCTNPNTTNGVGVRPNGDITPPGVSYARDSSEIIHIVLYAEVQPPMYTISFPRRKGAPMIGTTLNRYAMHVTAQ